MIDNINKLIGKPFDQIAFACKNRSHQALAASLMAGDWIEDEVLAEGFVHGKASMNRAHLMFNYDGPVEHELLCYLSGDNWVRYIDFGVGERFVLSHLGWHVEDADKASELLLPMFKVAQEVVTLSHTNPYLIEQRRTYRYIIHDSRASLGFDIKLIERIQADG